MMFLALLAVSLFIVESTIDLNENSKIIISQLDTAVLIIFTIDYFTRLLITKDKIVFIKKNIFDLIAIIPFSTVFRIARVARIARISRLLKITKFVRMTVWLNKYKKFVFAFFRTNGLIYVITITVLVNISGAIIYSKVENQNILDSIWWSFVTTTTVGYGDMSPVTLTGRIIAGILMLVGIGCIGMLTGTIATFFLKLPNVKSYKKETIDNIIEKLKSFDELSKDDVNDICNTLSVLKAKDGEENKGRKMIL
ncbi:MAG: potassium channel family protein [Vallitaleaceae bacterium]|nr:potassium channel family protein [Vallitaleaceae bacterium]